MYYLFVIIVGLNGGVSSESIPVESLSSCMAKREVFDDTNLVTDGHISARLRAFCVKGVK